MIRKYEVRLLCGRKRNNGMSFWRCPICYDNTHFTATLQSLYWKNTPYVDLAFMVELWVCIETLFRKSYIAASFHCQASPCWNLGDQVEVNKGYLCATLITSFMGRTLGPHGANRTQMGPMLAHEPSYLGIDTSIVGSSVFLVSWCRP